MNDDWPTDDAFFDPDDPAAVERERRRLEREERRSRRQAKRAQGYDVPTTGEQPLPAAQQEQPRPAGAQRPSATDQLEGPPRQFDWEAEKDRRPPRARRAPFAGRIAEMRARLEERRPARGPSRRGGPRSPDGGGPLSGLLSTLLANWKRIALALVGIVLIWFLIALFQPFHGSGSGTVAVRIPKGASVSEIGDILEKRGVVSDSTLFQIRATISGDRGDLLSGHYTLRHDMSYGDAIAALTKPPSATPVASSCSKTATVCTVTIPEGLSRPQVAPLASRAGLTGSYRAASIRSKYLNPGAYGGKQAKSLEGFLFPDTFDVKNGAPAADLVQLQLQDFKRRIKGVNMRYARSKNLTTYDVVTIASMIEREVQVPSERKLVAAVIYNRLHNGIPLGIDATIRFAVGNYTQPLTNSQLRTPSPYNTRINSGLPPGPIGSPGLAAIEAAAHPAKVDYLYYVVKPGTCGQLAFSSSYQQFLKDQQRYNSARAAAGGNSPTTC